MTPETAEHPVCRLFQRVFGAPPATLDHPLMSLGVSSLDLISFLGRIEAELHLPLESLLTAGTTPMSIAYIVAQHDRYWNAMA